MHRDVKSESLFHVDIRLGVEVCFKLSTLIGTSLIGASSSHGIQVQFHQVLRGATFLSRVAVATTLVTSARLVRLLIARLRNILSLVSTTRLTLSLALVLPFEVSRIARVSSIPLLLALSVSMYFWQRLSAHRTKVGFPK